MNQTLNGVQKKSNKLSNINSLTELKLLKIATEVSFLACSTGLIFTFYDSLTTIIENPKIGLTKTGLSALCLLGTSISGSKLKNILKKIDKVKEEEKIVENTSLKSVDVAVDWWVDHLKILYFDHGNMELDYFLNSIISKSRISESQLNLFQEALKKEITLDIIRTGESVLSVESNLCEHLSNASKKANINPTDFPFKVQMHITKDKTEVKDGYFKEWEIIYSKQDTKKLIKNL